MIGLGSVKIRQKRVPYAKKYTGFKKSTPPRVVTVVTNISYEEDKREKKDEKEEVEEKEEED